MAELHRTIFDPTGEPIPGGKLRCVVTVHDGKLSHDRFHAVALFGDGSVATWTESPEGRIEPFLAKLTPTEDAQAGRWLDDVATMRAAARDRFAPAATVVGISTRPGDRVETSYFASGDTPEPLDQLVQLLKRRLEATNAR